MTVIYAVAIGLSIGAAATVARRIGEKDPDSAARAAVQSHADADQPVLPLVLGNPLAWALAHPLGFGPTGVFVAVSVAFSTLAVVSAALFSRGSWKTRRV